MLDDLSLLAEALEVRTPLPGPGRLDPSLVTGHLDLPTLSAAGFVALLP